MTSYSDILGDVSRRPGVAAAALINADGLPINQRGARLDLDDVAALAATVLRNGAQLADALQRPQPHTIVLELGESLAVLAALDEHTALVVLLEPGASAGSVLADLHRLRARDTVPATGPA